MRNSHLGLYSITQTLVAKATQHFKCCWDKRKSYHPDLKEFRLSDVKYLNILMLIYIYDMLTW